MPKGEVLLLGLIHQYQWLEASPPSNLEREQRQKSIERIRQIVREFQPNIIADETPDTDNLDLLAELPSVPVPVDIPAARKRQRGFDIERSIHFVCPFVDSVRERYWRLRLHSLSKSNPEPRIFMMLGAIHLEPSFDRISFTDLVVRAGYAVRAINIYREAEWDHSWIHDWRHPVTPTTGPPPSLRCCVSSGSYQRDRRCERKIYWKEFLAAKEQDQPIGTHARRR